MKAIKMYLIALGGIFLSLIIMCLFLTTLYYFDLISTKTFSILKMISLIIIILVNSFILGKSSVKKGYLDGLKLGGIVSLIFLLISLISKNFDIKIFIYLIIILISSSLGSMIGINTKGVDTNSK